MTRLTEKRITLLTDVICFTAVCIIIGGLMYLTALAILAL